MFRFMSFGSGSCGNCYYICNDGYGLLIDAGIGIRLMKKHFSDYGLSFNNVNGILVTHDHADHVKAVGLLSATYGIPVYATERVHEGIRRNYRVRRKIDNANIKITAPGDELSLGGLSVTVFSVPHDSLENVGFKITCGETTLCLMTDIGHVTPEMTRFIGEADYLVIEANYDDEMLWAGTYPEYLKKRVSGGLGHLSNKLCAEAILNNASNRLKRVWLCHLSQENNHPELARKTVELRLRDLGLNGMAVPEVGVLRRGVPSDMFELV